VSGAESDPAHHEPCRQCFQASRHHRPLLLDMRGYIDSKFTDYLDGRACINGECTYNLNIRACINGNS